MGVERQSAVDYAGAGFKLLRRRELAVSKCYVFLVWYVCENLGVRRAPQQRVQMSFLLFFRRNNFHTRGWFAKMHPQLLSLIISTLSQGLLARLLKSKPGLVTPSRLAGFQLARRLIICSLCLREWLLVELEDEASSYAIPIITFIGGEYLADLSLYELTLVDYVHHVLAWTGIACSLAYDLRLLQRTIATLLIDQLTGCPGLAVEAGVWPTKRYIKIHRSAEDLTLALTFIIRGPFYNFVCGYAWLVAREERHEDLLTYFLLTWWWPISTIINIRTLWSEIEFHRRQMRLKWKGK